MKNKKAGFIGDVISFIVAFLIGTVFGYYFLQGLLTKYLGI